MFWLQKGEEVGPPLEEILYYLRPGFKAKPNHGRVSLFPVLITTMVITNLCLSTLHCD